MKRWWTCLVVLLLGCCWAEAPSGLGVAACGPRVVLSFPGSSERGRLYRCTEPFGPADVGAGLLPVAKPVPIDAGQTQYVDDCVGANTLYYYALQREGRWLAYPPVQTAPLALDECISPVLHVDKSRYTLTVMSQGRVLKRYPIAMGKTPWRRKFEQDHASTPEGRYMIYAAQPTATFHRAYDINYPLPVDYARHQLLGSSAPIGGEIQIHGEGIQGNWTWGCMALRNEDMDELFEHLEIGRGTPVWIYGGELTLADLQADCRRPKRMTAAELGRLQRRLGLPVTCLRDVATSRRLAAGAARLGAMPSRTPVRSLPRASGGAPVGASGEVVRGLFQD